MLLPATISSITAFWICEVILAGILACLLRPRRAPQCYHFWRGVTHYSSGFTVLSGLPGGMLMAGAFPGPSAASVLTIPAEWILAAAVFLWWVVCLDVMIATLSYLELERIAACLVVPLVGLVMIAFGCGCGFLIVLLTVDLTLC